VELGSILINWYQSRFDPWARDWTERMDPIKERGKMNRRDAGCSAGGFVTNFHMQVGLHEPNMESHIGSRVPGVRV
jgi:hypothetical protein